MGKTKQFKYSASVSLKSKNQGMYLGMVHGYNLEMLKHQARLCAQAAGLGKRKLLVNVYGTNGSNRSLVVLS